LKVGIPRRGILVLILSMLTFLAACGGGGDDGGGGGGEDLPTEAEVTSEDERVAHPLAEGRYRFRYSAPDCEEPTIQITQDGGSFTFSRVPTTAIGFVDGMPSGQFFIEIVGCDEWSISMTQI
jgi:hypothetical protein